MKKIILLLLTAGFLHISCKKETTAPTPQKTLPVANFTFNGSNLRAPVTVSFTNTSANASGYNWNLGNGQTSNSTDATATYNSGGNYSVSLKATNPDGENIITKNINILPEFKKVQITEVHIKKFPFTRPNGTSWDPLDGPDVYIFVGTPLVFIYQDRNDYFSNVKQSDLPLMYFLPKDVNYITNYDEDISVSVFDNDSFGDDEYIEGINILGFAPTINKIRQSTGQAYPASYTYTDNDFSCTIFFKWVE